MQPLDGNAIAGKLYEHFGEEMTMATGICRHCGTRAEVAELVVYTCAPGTVVRCPTCAGVVIVLVTAGDRLTVNIDHFTLTEGTIAGP